MPKHQRHINALTHPKNSAVVRYLYEKLTPDTPMLSCGPDEVENPYMRLGTHPEMVARLWDQITTTLPEACQWVVCRAPVLVRPDSGVIFGFAGGTHIYALRLPAQQRLELATATLQQAEKRADEFGLIDDRRRQYINAQSGDVWTYSNKTTFGVKSIGLEWAFGRWLQRESEWCLSAYEFAV